MVLLRGSGKSFSAGADLKDVERLYPGEEDPADGFVGIAFTQLTS